MQKVISMTVLWSSIAVSLSMTVLVFYIRYYQNINLPAVVYGGNILTYMMFFMLGLYLGKKSISHLSSWALLCATLIFYMLSCFESYELIKAFGRVGDSVTAVKPSSFLYSFSFILFLFRVQGRINSTILGKLGRMSFGIYLTHMFLLSFVTVVISKIFPDLINITVLYQLFVTLLVASGCYIAMSIFNSKISKDVGLKLGFF